MNKNQEAIFILGGGLKKNPDGTWRTSNYDEADNFGIQGDRLRVVAGSFLYKSNPKLLIIASGGKGQLRDIFDAPAVSQVIKKELKELGVPEEEIIEENISGNTYEQLREAKRFIGELGLKKINFLSNKWHLPRIKVMLENFPELKGIYNLAEVELKDAEEIVLKYDKKNWQKIIEQVYKSEGLKKRIELEEEGIKNIREGKYKLR